MYEVTCGGSGANVGDERPSRDMENESGDRATGMRRHHAQCERAAAHTTIDQNPPSGASRVRVRFVCIADAAEHRACHQRDARGADDSLRDWRTRRELRCASRANHDDPITPMSTPSCPTRPRAARRQVPLTT